MAKTFILRKVDDALWARFKAQAEKEGRPLRWVVLQLVAFYAEHGLAGLKPPRPD